MITIQSYLYNNTVPVQILDTALTDRTRDRSVYNRTVKIYKNQDNVLQLQVRNQDQKSVDITSKVLTFYVMAADSDQAVLTITPVVTSIKGGAAVTITRADLATLDQEFYNFSISYRDGDLDLPAYVDDNYGAAGQLQVLDNAFPAAL